MHTVITKDHADTRVLRTSAHLGGEMFCTGNGCEGTGGATHMHPWIGGLVPRN